MSRLGDDPISINALSFQNRWIMHVIAFVTIPCDGYLLVPIIFVSMAKPETFPRYIVGFFSVISLVVTILAATWLESITNSKSDVLAPFARAFDSKFDDVANSSDSSSRFLYGMMQQVSYRSLLLIRNLSFCLTIEQVVWFV
jgi:hypothetical protein